MYRSIGGLGSDVFVERIPGNALHIVLMFGDLSYELALQKLAVEKSGMLDESYQFEHSKF